MAGFTSFFEKRSRCSSVAVGILVQPKTPDNEREVPATPAKAATTSPIKINKGLVAGVAGANKQRDIENSIALDKYPCCYTATTATHGLGAEADPTSYEPEYKKGQERPVLTMQQLMAIPLRKCLDCFQFNIAGAYCNYYDAVMPAPTRPCRCRHYRLRGTVH